MILGCQVLKDVGAAERIGNPTPIDDGPKTAQVAAPQQPTTSYGQGQAAPQQSKPSQYVPSLVVNNSGNIAVYPIEGLSPYQNK
jgi:hypothetical protein